MNWTIFWQSLGVCLASAGTTLSLVGIFASVITAKYSDYHGLKRLVICALAVIACICIALIIGLPASYLVFTNFNIYRIPYVFPVIKTLLLFITIIIVCVVTSLFGFSKSKSETIIELLRKDEN